MTERLDIIKTHKLFIGGQFPRSESGRSLPVAGPTGEVVAHLCRASRKDLRDAVVAARGAQEGWARRDAYNRGQILYRMAEMVEGKRGEFVEALGATERRSGAATKGKAQMVKKGSTKRPSPSPSPKGKGDFEDEVSAAVDRLVGYAGWADKYQQILGCQNPVQGPYHNFTIPEGVGVVAVVAPDEWPLLGLVSMIAPAICSGSTVVALGSGANPIPTCIFGEVCATSDVPGGVVNLLTGDRGELLKWMAEHREIDAIHAGASTPEEAKVLRLGAAENVKRVVLREGVDWFDAAACEGPGWIEPLIEFKTLWHPAMV